MKDNEDAAGFVTTSGSATRVGGAPSTRDSVHVARLRAAGCIVLGKTNMPEFGLRGETDNRTFGITRNPWSHAHTPGGSSGGSAAAIAAGMVPLATGSDGGGSIRIPSSACGLTGLKPTLGRVPAADPDPPGWPNLSTKGPIARRAADVALALDAVVGPHPLDHRALPVTGDVGSWASATASSPGVPPRRIAWSPNLGYAEVDAEVVAVCRALVDAAADAGAEVVELETVFDARSRRAPRRARAELHPPHRRALPGHRLVGAARPARDRRRRARRPRGQGRRSPSCGPRTPATRPTSQLATAMEGFDVLLAR